MRFNVSPWHRPSVRPLRRPRPCHEEILPQSASGTMTLAIVTTVPELQRRSQQSTTVEQTVRSRTRSCLIWFLIQVRSYYIEAVLHSSSRKRGGDL